MTFFDYLSIYASFAGGTDKIKKGPADAKRTRQEQKEVYSLWQKHMLREIKEYNPKRFDECSDVPFKNQPKPDFEEAVRHNCRIKLINDVSTNTPSANHVKRILDSTEILEKCDNPIFANLSSTAREAKTDEYIRDYESGKWDKYPSDECDIELAKIKMEQKRN